MPAVSINIYNFIEYQGHLKFTTIHSPNFSLIREPVSEMFGLVRMNGVLLDFYLMHLRIPMNDSLTFPKNYFRVLLKIQHLNLLCLIN